MNVAGKKMNIECKFGSERKWRGTVTDKCALFWTPYSNNNNELSLNLLIIIIVSIIGLINNIRIVI